MTTPARPGPITVAGWTRDDPLSVVESYLHAHGGTVEHFDFEAGKSPMLTPALIAATRSPWMNSRISKAEEAWFLDRAQSAPWSNTDGTLVDADPLVADGLYDRAASLYDHFRLLPRSGVAVAKISKVLYLMRPHLFPILDSRLTRRYAAQAREATVELRTVRPDVFAGVRRSYWAAYRADLLTNADGLTALRDALRDSRAPRAAKCANDLSDVRLLDMLAWRSE